MTRFNNSDKRDRKSGKENKRKKGKKDSSEETPSSGLGLSATVLKMDLNFSNDIPLSLEDLSDSED